MKVFVSFKFFFLAEVLGVLFFLKILTLFLVGTVLAAGDNKDGTKAKRAYSLGYGYEPYTAYYEHAPVASAVVAHAPVAEVHHAPVVAHAPIVAPAFPAVAPLSKITSSIVSTNVHHYPASYYAPPAPIISAAPYYPAPAYTASSFASYVAPAYAHSPLVTEFHRR